MIYMIVQLNADWIKVRIRAAALLVSLKESTGELFLAQDPVCRRTLPYTKPLPPSRTPTVAVCLRCNCAPVLS